MSNLINNTLIETYRFTYISTYISTNKPTHIPAYISTYIPTSVARNPLLLPSHSPPPPFPQENILNDDYSAEHKVIYDNYHWHSC